MNKTLKKWDPKFDHFLYHRICRLEECEIEIHTNRKDHLFCEPNHQQLHWRRVRKQRRKHEAMVREHEKRLEALEEEYRELAKAIEKIGKEAVKAVEDFRKAFEGLKKKVNKIEMDQGILQRKDYTR